MTSGNEHGLSSPPHAVRPLRPECDDKEALSFLKDRQSCAVLFAHLDDAVGAATPNLHRPGAMKGLSNERIRRLRQMRAGELLQRHAAGKAAVALEFDAVVEDHDGGVAGVVGIIAVHHGVEEDFTEGFKRNWKAVFPEDRSRGKPGAQRHGPFEKRHALAHHGKSVHAILPVVHNLAGDLRAPKSPHLKKALGIVGQESGSIKYLGGVSKNTVNTQSQPVENFADIAAGIRRNPVLLNGQLACSQDFLGVQVLQRHRPRHGIHFQPVVLYLGNLMPGEPGRVFNRLLKRGLGGTVGDDSSWPGAGFCALV